MRTAQHEKRLRDAMLELLAYFGAYGLPLSEKQVYQYLPVKTTPVAVKAHLQRMQKRGLVVAVDTRYGIKGADYSRLDLYAGHQARLMSKAKKWGRVFRLPPFIKSVVIVSSLAYGHPTETSDIDLVIVTTPNRIYLAKAYMYALFRTFDIDAGKEKLGRFGVAAYITTAGVKFDKDMGQHQYHRGIWLLGAKPLYGADTWYEILRNSPFLQPRTPNYVWPRVRTRIPRSGLGVLDHLDTRAYKRYLQNVSSKPAYQQPGAFVRVRPDVIFANPCSVEQLAKLDDGYKTILAGLKKS